ncbi:elongation factor P--(R)-beta-lysine ligase [Aurantivibrio plasticivorans]
MANDIAPESDSRWRPTAANSMLQARASLYQSLRQFFDAQGYTEVDVPLLGLAGTSDLHIESFLTDTVNPSRYLQTSPEFAMKRLLAAGSGPIYSITKSFRLGERGKNHNPEFTILEWYRPGFDDHALMQEVSAFLGPILSRSPKITTYQQLFEDTLGVDPLTMPVADLKKISQLHLDVDSHEGSRDFWLDLLFSHVIQPTLVDQLWFVHDYPASQAALAKVTANHSGVAVARRFEVFCEGVELGNGYWELTDSSEQRRRFEKDNAQRITQGLDAVNYDESLLAALEYGLPECAGIAIGVDRLLMVLHGCDDIADVLTFPFEIA